MSRTKAIKSFVSANKAVSALFAVAALSALYGGFTKGDASTETRYILGTVERGTVVSTVSGTGTVSASNQIDLKAKASGDVLSVKVKAGDHVSAGQTLVTLDGKDAYTAYRTAQLSYDKLVQPADDATQVAAQSALSSAIAAERRAYDASLTEVASTFLDVPTVFDGLDSMFGQTGYLADTTTHYVDDVAVSYRSTAAADFVLAKNEYQALLPEYHNISPTAATSSVESLNAHTYAMVKTLAQALRETKTAVDYIKTKSDADSAAAGVAAQTSVATWTDKVSGHLTALLSASTDLSTGELTVTQKQAELDKLLAGADPLDIESAALNLSQKRDAYNDSFITAPFAGVVGKVDVKAGDSVSTGAAIATLVTPDQVATISLNEVDAAKVRTGDKATLTFDAVDGLTLTGVVSEVDLVGTVTQGVVTYNAKIVFDANDPRVLSGMSVSAEIITEAKNDVLTVPASAVKTSGGTSYVLTFTPPLPPSSDSSGVVSAVPPQETPVELGWEGDTSVEITGGLTEGEQIVTRTVSPTSKAGAQAPSIFGAGNQPRGATGGARALGR